MSRIPTLRKMKDGRSFLVLVFFSGFSSLLSFVTGALIARGLGVEGFGEFSVFFTVFVLTWTVTNFGEAAYVRFAATAPSEDGKMYLVASWILKLVVMLPVVIFAAPLAAFLADHAFERGDLYFPVLMGLLTGASLNLVGLVAATFQAREQFTRYASVNVVPYGLVLLSVAALSASGELTLDSTLWTYLVVGIVCFALSMVLISRAAGSLRASREHVVKVLHFAKWSLVANTLFILVQRLDILFVARYADAASLGTYGAAVRITVIATLAIGSIAPFLLPSVGKAGRSSNDLAAFLRRALVLSGALTAAVAAVWVAVPILVPWLFGEAYEDAVAVARVLLFGTAALAAYTPLSQIFLAEERPRRMVYLTVVKLLSLSLFLALWVPRDASMGAARAVVVAELVTLVYCVATALVVIRNMGRRFPTPTKGESLR